MVDNPILINFLILIVGTLFGYITGKLKSDYLEKSLSNEILKGNEVAILINKKGISYQLKDDKIYMSEIVLEKEVEKND